jgi:hypothetical protein
MCVLDLGGSFGEYAKGFPLQSTMLFSLVSEVPAAASQVEIPGARCVRHVLKEKKTR